MSYPGLLSFQTENNPENERGSSRNLILILENLKEISFKPHRKEAKSMIPEQYNLDILKNSQAHTDNKIFSH